MRFLKRLFLILALLIIGAGMPDAFTNAGQAVSGGLLGLRDSWVISGRHADMRAISSDVTEAGQETAKRAMPGVVTVYGITNEDVQDVDQDPSGLRRMFSSRVKVSSGSGFFVDSDGYIVTNRHVVDEDDARYSVVLDSGERVRAEVVYRDTENDLAILKVSGSDYPVLPLSGSDSIERGSYVVSIGNAFGDFPESVSQGTVTAMSRTLIPTDRSLERLRGVMETTAVLYPGYSGGPMLSLDGQVVAVNVAAAVDEPLSYGIPIERVKEMVETVSLIEKDLGYTE